MDTFIQDLMRWWPLPSCRSCVPCPTLLPPCQGPAWTEGGGEWHTDRPKWSPYTHHNFVTISPVKQQKRHQNHKRSKKHSLLQKLYQNQKCLKKQWLLHFLYHCFLFSALKLHCNTWSYTKADENFEGNKNLKKLISHFHILRLLFTSRKEDEMIILILIHLSKK